MNIFVIPINPSNVACANAAQNLSKALVVALQRRIQVLLVHSDKSKYIEHKLTGVSAIDFANCCEGVPQPSADDIAILITDNGALTTAEHWQQHALYDIVANFYKSLACKFVLTCDTQLPSVFDFGDWQFNANHYVVEFGMPTLLAFTEHSWSVLCDKPEVAANNSDLSIIVHHVIAQLLQAAIRHKHSYVCESCASHI